MSDVIHHMGIKSSINIFMSFKLLNVIQRLY